MLLVDSGRFAYSGTDLSNTLHTQYGPYAFAHNTLTLDGADQLPLPAVAAAPVPPAAYSFSPSADWVVGSMAQWSAELAGRATHTRAVYYARAAAPGGGEGDFLVVADALASDRPRAVEATWHAHPNASGVAVGGPGAGRVAVVGGADTFTGKPMDVQACIIPATGAGAAAWDAAEVVRGVMQNGTQHYQGWYSQSYDDASPAPTLVYRAAAVPDGALFVWLIVPQGARGPCADTAEVLSRAAGSVVVRATVGGVAHTVTVPTVSP